MLNRRTATTGCAMAAAVFMAACADMEPTVPTSEAPETVSLFGGPANPQAHQSRDDRMAAISHAVPGYGGHFFDETGALNVYMTGGAAPSRAATALRGELAALGVDPGAQPVRIIDGDYSFAQLHAARLQLRAVLGLAGVAFLDVDDTANRVRIGVANIRARSSVQHALGMLDVNPAMVVVSDAQPFEYRQTLRDRVRPVAGGLQINYPGWLCTLGFNVRSPEAPNVHGFVTNSHCTNVQGRVDNTPYWQPSGSQPSPADPNFIGTEVHDLEFSDCGGTPCRYSDAAGVQYASGVDNAFARIYRTTGPGSLQIAGMYTITAERPFPNLGDTMHKVGRTTGWTSGTVVASCADTPVDGILLLCQEHVQGSGVIVGGGDSGAPVFDNISGDNVRLVGILWGGTQDGTLFAFSAMSEVRFENSMPGFTWTTF